jgi:uroporphyrinogen-III decarboxylase
MNARERLQRAISGRATDMTAVAPAYLGLYLAGRVQALYVESHRVQPGGATGIDHGEDSRLRAEAILDGYRVFEEAPDWIHTEIGELPDSTRYTQRVRASNADLWDETNGLRTRADAEALTPVHSWEELDAQGVFEVTRILHRSVGDHVCLVAGAPTPFWSTYSLLGFQGMMILMRERPELFRTVMERKSRQRLEILEGLARAGVQAVWIEECLSSADLISPQDYEQFAFPTARDFIADANRLGLTTVFYYCGDVIPRLPWLRQLGMAALAVEESKKGFTVDLADVIAGLDGACCVFGNVDAIRVVCEGSQEEIEAEVRRQVALGRRAKGFVLCQGSPFPLETDPRKIDCFTRAARRAG